jgi:hypothetical protein
MWAVKSPCRSHLDAPRTSPGRSRYYATGNTLCVCVCGEREMGFKTIFVGGSSNKLKQNHHTAMTGVNGMPIKRVGMLNTVITVRFLRFKTMKWENSVVVVISEYQKPI